MFKIISKMLANRLKHVLLGIISPTQSGLIANNALIAFELLHTMTNKRYGKEGRGYSIEVGYGKHLWPCAMEFFKGYYGQIGLCQQMNKSSKCSVFLFSILINGSLKGVIFIKTRVLNSPPISSSYVLKALSSSLLKQSQLDGSLKVLGASKLGPKLYHLLFTWLHYFLSSCYSKIVQTSKIIWISMRQLLVNMWISPHYSDFSSVLIPTTKARHRHQILLLLGAQHRREITLINICGRSVLVSPFYIQSYFSNPIATVDMFNWSIYKILEYSSAWACFSSKGCGEHKIWGVLYP